MDSDVKLNDSVSVTDEIDFDTIRNLNELSPSMVAELLFKVCSNPNNNVYYINELAAIVTEKLPESSLTKIVEEFSTSSTINQKFILCEKTNLQSSSETRTDSTSSTRHLEPPYFNFNQFLNFCHLLSISEDQANSTIGILFFYQTWERNQLFQYGLIKFCIDNNHVGNILSNCSNQSVSLNKKITLKYLPQDVQLDGQIETWKFYSLYQILIDLAQIEKLTLLIETIFSVPLMKCPDFMVLGLLECKTNTPLKESLMINAITKFLYPASVHHNATLIFQKLWPNDSSTSQLSWSQTVLLKAMCELYNNSNSEDQQLKLSRILDLAQDLKALNHLLACSSLIFVIDLACLASRREYLKLDKWLPDKIDTIGPPFVEACITFLKRRCNAFMTMNDTTTINEGFNGKFRASLPTDTMNIMFNCFQQYLRNNNSPAKPHDYELLKMCTIYSQFLLFPRTQVSPAAPSLPDSQLMGNITYNISNPEDFFFDIHLTFPKDVEDEADLCFQKIYTHEQPDSIDMKQFFDLLKKLQHSKEEHDQNLFRCMLRNLLREYRYLDQYPERELVITGEIFGGLIQHGLIFGVVMITVLKYILDSLKKSPEGKLFRFAIAALEQFKHRLKEYPFLCSQLYSLPHFEKFPDHLHSFIRYGQNSSLPQTILNDSNGDKANSQFLDLTKMNNEMLNPSMTPDSSTSQQQKTTMNEVNFNPEIKQLFMTIKDKLQFMFNNLDPNKIETFAGQIKEILDNPEFFIPISNYFTKRAIAESNHHKLFMKLLSTININELFNLITSKTYNEISVLYRGNSDMERKHLKSAALWLGLLTLSRNRPILSIYLDLHTLLMEAYCDGSERLNLSVALVSKVLTGCADSTVFKPPNPWTVSLLNMLAEIYYEVKSLNIQFEIEILCNVLEINIEEYKGKCIKLKLYKQLDTAKKQIESSSRMTQIDQPIQPAILNQYMQSQRSLQPSPAANMLIPSNTIIPPPVEVAQKLNQKLKIRENLQLIKSDISMIPMIETIIENILYEWVKGAVERVTKECVTVAENIVKKDFALDPNAETLRSTGHQFLNYIISGFAYIYSKEQLFELLFDAVHKFLQSKFKISSKESKELIDITATTIVNDNIDLCILFVQRKCFERAVEELDARFKVEYELRRNRSESVPYYDTVALAIQNERLPEQIRNKCGPTPPNKMQVYDQIRRSLSGINQLQLQALSAPMHHSNNDGTTIPNKQPMMSPMSNNLVNHSNNNSINKNFSLTQSPDSGTMMLQQPAIHLYDQMIKNSLDLKLEFERVHYNSEVIHQVTEYLKHLKQSPRDQAVAHSLIITTINGLRELLHHKEVFTDLSVLTGARDFYLLVMKGLTDQRAFNTQFIANITRCVMENWFEANQSFPDDLFDLLSKVSLINFATLDIEMHRLLEQSQNSMVYTVIINFLLCYIRNSANVSIFSNTLNYLRKIAMKYKTAHPFHLEMKQLFEQITVALAAQSPTQNIIGTQSSNGERNIQNKTIESLFKEWVIGVNTETIDYKAFVKNLCQHGFLNSEDTLMQFSKSCLEICIDATYTILNYPNQSTPDEIHSKCFQYLDPYAYMTLIFTKLKDDYEFKMRILSRTLNNIAYVALQDQEQKQQLFHHLSYYRILVVLFLEYFNNESFNGSQHTSYPPPKPVLDESSSNVVKLFANTLRIMAPTRLPSFTYAWLEIISHRTFIGACLNDYLPANHMWNQYFFLIGELLQYVKPYIQHFDLTQSFRCLYRGILKLFLLLLHDFPDFLCEYCYMICDLIPHSTFQIRSLVLSAFPASMRLPDPFSSNLKVESLNEILHPYKGLINPTFFEKLPFKNELENYLKSRGSHYLSEIQQYFNLNTRSLQDQLISINLIVFYFGQQAIKIYTKINFNTISNCPSIDVIQHLLANLDTERRYFLLSSMTNHLRYPNLETQYFICALLYLFKESDVLIKEQIVRVFLERLFVYRPHPWGLLYTVNELSKNPIYNFWNYDFIKFEPKFKRLLGNLGIYNNTSICNSSPTNNNEIGS